MSFRTSILVFFLLISAGLGSYFALQRGWYPVAIVNFDFITKKDLAEDSVTAYQYFKKDFLARGSDARILDTPESRQEIHRAVLDNLIANALVYQELNRRLKNEYQVIAENKIEEAIKNNVNLEAGVKAIYGLDFPEFKKRVLLPQAYQEILEGRMFLNNENFSEWLNDSRASANVIILLPNLQWQDSSVKLRG